MKVKIIVVLWLLLGAYFFWSKSKCCADSKQTAPVSSSTSVSNAESGLTKDIDSKAPFIKFDSSSAILKDRQAADSVVVTLQEVLNEGNGLKISGLAFQDEEDTEALGLQRAEVIKSLLKPNVPGSVIIRSELINEPYSESAEFISYEVVELDEASESSYIALDNTDNILLYISDIIAGDPLTEQVEEYLWDIVTQMKGHLNKVNVVSYSDDNSNALISLRRVEDFLIKKGINPNRIKTKRSSLGDRDTEIVELTITT